MKKIKSGKVIAVPRDLKEAAEFFTEMTALSRESQKIQDELNERIEELKTQAMSKIEPNKELISHLFNGLYVFAETNREKLITGKKKSIDLPTGSFGWRISQPYVSFKNAGAVLETLIKQRLKKFFREKTIRTVDKEAMLKHEEEAKQIKGVFIVRHEEFFAKPAEIDFEISKKLKKIVS